MLFDTYKGLTHRAKPFSLEQRCYPINQSIHHTRHRAVDDDRAGDGEHFGTDTEDEALTFKLHCRGGHGVGETRDGHQRACARIFGNIIVHVKRRKQHADGDKRQRTEQAGILVFKAGVLRQQDHNFAQRAQQAPYQKGTRTIAKQRRFWGALFGDTLILLFGDLHDISLPADSMS